MDDYYSLLGVEPDAQTDEIRTAYRDRKASLDASSDGSKADAAQLNKAWNVLSDPYQRGRYDLQREQTADAGDDIDDAPVDVQSNGSSKPSRFGSSSQKPAPRPRQGREPLPPTISPPDGTHYPATRQRITAMAIDLGVLLLLVVLGTFAIVPAVAKSQKPEIVDRVDQLNKVADQKTEAESAAKKNLDDAKNAQPPVQANVDSAQKAYDAAKQETKDATKAVSEESKKLFGLSIAVMGFIFLLGLAYLVIPSMRTGATLGKRFQHLKVVREDGSPIGFGDAVKRYGPLVLVAFALLITPIGLLGAAIVLFGVLRWMRNPNFQGIHDRFAHTIVVTDRQS